MEQTLPPERCYRLVLEDAFSRLRQKQGKLDDALRLAQHAADGARKTLPEVDPSRHKHEQHLGDLQTAKTPAKTADDANQPSAG